MTEIRFSDGRPYQAAWLCYINGLEIPIEGSEIHFGVWQMPVATLRLTPHPLMQRIGSEDRLQVVLFYLDEFYEPDNPKFRLWGEYEITGWGYSSSSGSRQLQLDCVAQIQIFKQMQFSHLSAYKNTLVKKQVDGVIIGDGPVTVNFTEAELEFADFASSEIETVDPALVSKLAKEAGIPVPNRRSFINRPLDLILHIFKAVLSPVHTEKNEEDTAVSERKDEWEKVFDEEGHFDPNKMWGGTVDPVKVKKYAKERKDAQIADEARHNEYAGKPAPAGKVKNTRTSVISKNFYARWMKMTRFHKRWCALPMFEDGVSMPGCFPIVKETGGYDALRSLQKHAGTRRGYAWDMFMRIYTKMYMEIAMIPCPPVAAVQKRTGNIIGKDITNPKTQFKGILSYFIKPQCFFSLPPMCNVLFPSMLNNTSHQESYIAQPTRIKIRGGHGSNLARQLAAGTNSTFRKIVSELMHGGFPSVVYKRGAACEKAPGANDENFLIFPEEMFKGPVVRRVSTPPWMRHILKRAGGAKKTKQTDEERRHDTYLPGESTRDKTATKKLTKGTQELFKKYAEYEFFRTRYEQRNGSSSALFQPYLLPGFPIMTFDQKASGFDYLGYLTTVSHSFSRTGKECHVNTQVGVAFIRPLQEEERDQVKEPLTSICTILQSEEKAAEFYKTLLFRKEKTPKPTVFEKDNIVEVTNEKYHIVGPKPEYKEAFKDYGAAMRLVSRPVCTLKEYIEAWHGKDLDTLLAEGKVLGENRSFYSVIRDPTPGSSHGGAVYWSRIYKLKQGGGPQPSAKITNIQDDEDESPVVGGFKPVDDTHGDMSQTRYDWDTTLERYRSILYGEGIGSVPQE